MVLAAASAGDDDLDGLLNELLSNERSALQQAAGATAGTAAAAAHNIAPAPLPAATAAVTGKHGSKHSPVEAHGVDQPAGVAVPKVPAPDGAASNTQASPAAADLPGPNSSNAWVQAAHAARQHVPPPGAAAPPAAAAQGASQAAAAEASTPSETTVAPPAPSPAVAAVLAQAAEGAALTPSEAAAAAAATHGVVGGISGGGEDDSDELDMLEDMEEVLAADLLHGEDPSGADRGPSSGDLQASTSWSQHSQQQLQPQRGTAGGGGGGSSFSAQPRGSGIAAAAPAAAAAKPGAGVAAPHEAALAAAKEYERQLSRSRQPLRTATTTTTSSSSGGSSSQQLDGTAAASHDSAAGAEVAPVKLDPLTDLSELLKDAKQDWNVRGRPDTAGSMVGGAVLLKMEGLNMLAGTDLSGYLTPHGRPQVIASVGQYIAMGMANGVTLVIQLPTPQQQSAAAGGGGHGGGAAAAGGGVAGAVAQVWSCGEVRHAGEGVTAVGFSSVAGPSDGLWLAVGHASGALVLWELQRRGPKQLASVGEWRQGVEGCKVEVGNVQMLEMLLHGCVAA